MSSLTSAGVVKIGNGKPRPMRDHEKNGQTCSWVYDSDDVLVPDKRGGTVWRPDMCGAKATYVSKSATTFAVFYCTKHAKAIISK